MGISLIVFLGVRESVFLGEGVSPDHVQASIATRYASRRVMYDLSLFSDQVRSDMGHIQPTRRLRPILLL